MHTHHTFVTVGERRTHLLHGEGAPKVLFLHGVGGSAWTFDATLGHWSPPGWVVPDLLGYGESSWLPDGRYSSAVQAEQLVGVLDQLAVDRVAVVGFSWGGLIGLELAARDPRVCRLAVLDIAPSTSLASTAVPMIPESYPSMDEALAVVQTLAPRANAAVAKRDAELSTTPCAEGFRKKIDPKLLRRWPFREEDHWEHWCQNQRDTLLVRAEHSVVLSADDAHQMLDANPSATYRQIPDSGHLIPLEQPLLLAKVLSDFVA